MRTKIQVRKVANVAVVDIKGHLAIGTGAEEFYKAICELIDGGERRILVNFEGMRAIDGPGVGAVCRCLSHARERESELRICHVTEEIPHVTRGVLARIFNIYESEERALASFGPGHNES